MYNVILYRVCVFHRTSKQADQFCGKVKSHCCVYRLVLGKNKFTVLVIFLGFNVNITETIITTDQQSATTRGKLAMT